MCRLTVLNTQGETTVSYCTECQRHYVWQHSFLLTFSILQFASFASEVEEKKLDREYLRFPDGMLRTFLETPMQEVLLTFTEEEWGDFSRAVQESVYMREIHDILNKDIKS